MPATQYITSIVAFLFRHVCTAAARIMASSLVPLMPFSFVALPWVIEPKVRQKQNMPLSSAAYEQTIQLTVFS